MGLVTTFATSGATPLGETVSPRARPQRTRVLVADPDEDVRGRLGAALAAAGYAVDTAASAHALVDSVLGAPTQLVAVGLDLPDLDAASLMQGLRRLCATPSLVVLASYGADPRRGPLRQSAAACLFKPVDSASFVGTCQRVLRMSERRASEVRSEPRRAVRIDVVVEAPGGALVNATLVNLSSNGFQLELPDDSTEVGQELRVLLAIPGSSQMLTFEGRVDWDKPLSRGALAGGSLLRVGPEDERILGALVHPLE
jgi:DNA-binding response OmpR family regulator